MLARTFSAQTIGLSTTIISVEVDISRGLHTFSIVGLPDRAVEEARDRISAALKNSGFTSPQKGNRKVVVSLAPADTKKEGPVFDLAIALASLAALREVTFDPHKKLFVGELSLDGTLRPIKGVLLVVQKAKEAGFTEVYIPDENKEEAGLIKGIAIYPVRTLKDVVFHLDPRENDGEEGCERRPITPLSKMRFRPKTKRDYEIDFSDISGQEPAKRGLEIAAAGGHNVALVGPPGTGKTLLAKAFPAILPSLTDEDVLQVTGIHSAAGTLIHGGVVTEPPYKAPHHTASYVSLVGGGTWPKPGEITLAHKGVLFLDEFPEFEKRVIEALRQPLEDRVVRISRSRDSVEFPADFILLAAMNLCPCGNTGRSRKECVCTPSTLMRYQRKISGPIIDRIDLWLPVPEIPLEKLSDKMARGETSQAVRARITKARDFQREHLTALNLPISTISAATARHIEKLVPLSPDLMALVTDSMNKLSLSARAFHKTLKVAKTIASLDGREEVIRSDLLEALQYRPKDFWSLS